MFQWAKDWVMDKVYGAASTAIQAGGNMAGNTVGGVGTMIENSGRGVGQSASGLAGYVGGVGSYINSYGDSIINSTAASGGGGSSAEKKVAVKPSSAVGGGGSKPKNYGAPSNAKTPPKPAGAKRTPPTKAPPAKPPPANKPGPKPVTTSTSTRPKISASAADKTPDGKVRVSAASRPGGGVARAGPQAASSGVKKNVQSNGGPRPLPKISAGKNDRTADGKVKISAASRPRPVKA